MERLINQFRRIYADNGGGDVDFTGQETRLREAADKLIKATAELVRASERLNQAVVGLEEKGGSLH